METRWFRRGGALVAVLALMVGTTRLPAQIVQFSGSVTAVTGAFVGDVFVGSPVAVSLDLCAPLVDLFPEEEGLGSFLGRRIGLRIDGRPYPVDSWPSEVLLSCGLEGWWAGLSVGASWPAIENPRVVVLALLGETDLIVSDTVFPAGIPMESFTYHEGTYRTPEGQVDWTIDAYTVAAAVSAPEPATYGWLATAVLVGLAGWRRLRQEKRGARSEE